MALPRFCLLRRIGSSGQSLNLIRDRDLQNPPGENKHWRLETEIERDEVKQVLEDSFAEIVLPRVDPPLARHARPEQPLRVVDIHPRLERLLQRNLLALRIYPGRHISDAAPGERGRQIL